MSVHKNLLKARKNARDEFYTSLEDIEKEVRFYRDHFRDKVVYCNCDDPRISNFFHYFSYNFEKLGLKKLIASCYQNNQMDLFSRHDSEQAIYLEYTGEKDGGNVPTIENIGVKHFQSDGDFRSAEAIELLKEADVVVTNPPFSLFREYIAQLMEYDKTFLIIGNVNALTYREVFPLFRANKVWFGKSIKSGDREFQVPDHYPLKAAGFRVDEKGNKFIRIKGVRWFTNLEYPERHEDIILYKKYNPEDYPKYENYNAINVNKTAEIPKDYDGVMGVPITFMDRHNPDQFEIIGLGISNSGLEVGVQPYKPEHKTYRREVQKRGAVDGDLYMIENGEVKVPYARILIRNKKVVK